MMNSFRASAAKQASTAVKRPLASGSIRRPTRLLERFPVDLNP
jgi:hypothetical protein